MRSKRVKGPVRCDISGLLEKGGLGSKCKLSAFSRGVSLRAKGASQHSPHAHAEFRLQH